MNPWTVLDTVQTPEGVLELRLRDNEFLIVIDGRVLMNSHSRSSEEELARLAIKAIAQPPPQSRQSAATLRPGEPRLLIAGLGMGFTLRAALDSVSPTADVTVCEINKVVVEWCRGPLAGPTRNAIKDHRVTVKLEDVAKVIAASPANRYDAILLDLYEGPHQATQKDDDPFYSAAALARSHKTIRVGGVLSVWSEDADAAFEKRFTAAGFDVSSQSIGSGGRRHFVYVGRKK
jgi:spermidine synthase